MSKAPANSDDKRAGQAGSESAQNDGRGPAEPRRDLGELRARLARGSDAQRAAAVAKRRARGFRSARENLHDLIDAGSFSEYGALAVAAQRGRRDYEQLQRETPADGVITGLARVNGAYFAAAAARTALLI